MGDTLLLTPSLLLDLLTSKWWSAQEASCADHHLLVSKSSSKEGVSSNVSPIAGEQRVTEIARMLGGEKLSATTLAHAREMLTK